MSLWTNVERRCGCVDPDFAPARARSNTVSCSGYSIPPPDPNCKRCYGGGVVQVLVEVKHNECPRCNAQFYEKEN